MSITMHNMVIFVILQAVAVCIVVPISWLTMSYIIPRSLLERYFKAPDFGPTELILLAQFPGSLMRGSGFSAICVFPRLGKKRNMTDIRDHAPTWYMWASKFHWYIVMGLLGFSWILLSLILMVMLPFVD